MIGLFYHVKATCAISFIYIENCFSTNSSNFLRFINLLFPTHKTNGQLSSLEISLILLMPMFEYSAASSIVKFSFSQIGTLISALLNRISISFNTIYSKRHCPNTTAVPCIHINIYIQFSHYIYHSSQSIIYGAKTAECLVS